MGVDETWPSFGHWLSPPPLYPLPPGEGKLIIGPPNPPFSKSPPAPPLQRGGRGGKGGQGGILQGGCPITPSPSAYSAEVATKAAWERAGVRV